MKWPHNTIAVAIIAPWMLAIAVLVIPLPADLWALYARDYDQCVALGYERSECPWIAP